MIRLFSTNNNKIQLTPEQIAMEVAKVEKYKLFIRQPGNLICSSISKIFIIYIFIII